MSEGFRVIVLEEAEQDLHATDAWLIENKPELARHWVGDIEAAVRTLAQLPTRCPRMSGAGSKDRDVRKLVAGRDVIVFEITGRDVLVLRIFHEGRDPAPG